MNCEKGFGGRSDTTNVIRAGNFAIFLTFSSRAFEGKYNKIQDSGWEMRRGRKLKMKNRKFIEIYCFAFILHLFIALAGSALLFLFSSRLKMKLISYESFYYDFERADLFCCIVYHRWSRSRSKAKTWSSPEWDCGNSLRLALFSCHFQLPPSIIYNFLSLSVLLLLLSPHRMKNSSFFPSSGMARGAFLGCEIKPFSGPNRPKKRVDNKNDEIQFPIWQFNIFNPSHNWRCCCCCCRPSTQFPLPCFLVFVLLLSLTIHILQTWMGTLNICLLMSSGDARRCCVTLEKPLKLERLVDAEWHPIGESEKYVEMKYSRFNASREKLDCSKHNHCAELLFTKKALHIVVWIY